MKHNGLTLCCSWRWTTAAADLPRPVSFFRLRRDLIFFFIVVATILYFFFGWYVSISLLLLAIIPCEFPKPKSFSIVPYSDVFSPKLKSQLFPCTESELVFCFVCLYYCCFVFKFCSLLCSPSQLCRWLKEVFLSADKSGDGLLSVDEVFSLMHKLNVKISNRKLRETFKVCVCISVFPFTRWPDTSVKVLFVFLVVVYLEFFGC